MNIITILNTFSNKELKDFDKWLHSPLHNQRTDIISLFHYIQQYLNNNSNEPFDKVLFFEKIDKNSTYDDAKMRQIIFFLNKSIEEFLTYKELVNDKTQSAYALARVFRHRKLDKNYTKTYEESLELIHNAVYKNIQYHRDNYLLQLEKYNYVSKDNRMTDLNLQNISDTLDIAFIADKMRQTCLMLSHQTVYKMDYQIGLLEAIVIHIHEKELLTIPAIAIYYYSYKTLTDKSDAKHFVFLLQQILENGHLFPKAEMRDIVILAVNYCIGQINAGNKSYTKSSFDLYLKGLEENIFIEANYISRFTFRNIVSAGLILKEFDWVYKFIQDYSNFLEPNQREQIVDYNLAKYFFEKKDYKNAMQLLIQSDYDDILVNLNAKTILVKIFYELNEFDALESLLESFRTYLQRKDVIGYHKTNYKNIIKYTKKLLHLSPNSAKKLALKNEIENINPLSEKEWMMGMLEK